MRKGARRLGLALLLVLLAACGQPSGTSPSARPSKAASPSPTPLFGFPVASGVTCPDLASLGLERALLNPGTLDRKDVILCDARDAGHPGSLQALEGSSSQRFLGRDLIGYVALKGGEPSSSTDQFTSVITTLNLTTGQTAELASSPGLALAAGWSADGSTVAYFTDSGGVHHYWLKRGGAAPVAFSTSAQVVGRGGSRDDMLLVAFSPDGQYVLVVDTHVYRLQLFKTSDASLVYAAPSGVPADFALGPSGPTHVTTSTSATTAASTNGTRPQASRALSLGFHGVPCHRPPMTASWPTRSERIARPTLRHVS